MPCSPLILHSQQLWPRICRELREATTIDSELRWTGMLFFPSEDRVKTVEAWGPKTRLSL